MKRIILCADDYGQNSAISQAIVDLLEKKRLSATSCLTNFDAWTRHAGDLKPYLNQADIGLHLNLTEGRPACTKLKALYPLNQLILKAHLGQIDKQAIYTEFNAQLDRFIDAMGCAPRFIDGHQHIHQLPFIRDIVLRIYQERLHTNLTYVRSTYIPQAWLRYKDYAYIKQIIIQCCGARALEIRLNQLNIPHNTSFAGIYDFTQATAYPQVFAYLLSIIRDGGLIMCHPGASTDLNDPISTARDQEYNYFNHPQFLNDCSNAGVTITRFDTAHTSN